MLEPHKETPTDSSIPIPDLSRTHLHVLQILWDAGVPLKPAEIEEKFQWPVENATLRSVLRVLMDRQEVTREKQGRAFVYLPRRKRTNALSELFTGLAEVFSSGSRAGLIAQLLQDESLTESDVRELKKIASRKSTSSGAASE